MNWSQSIKLLREKMLLTQTEFASRLDEFLPNSYNKEVFASKTNLLLSVFVDKAVQGIAFYRYE